MPKYHRLFGPLTLIVLVAACTSSRRSSRSNPAHPTQPGAPGQPPPTPGAAAPAQHPLAWLFPGGVMRLPQPPPALGVFRPINTRALVANMHRYPCKPAEVSPGNWVNFDCGPPSFVRRATRLVPQRGFVSGFEGTGSGGSVGALPDGVDHRSNGMEGPMKNQGAVGTCTALSLSSAMEHAYRMMNLPEPISALHVWSQYRVPKMGEAGDSNIDKRLSTEQTWTYDPAVACKMLRSTFDSCGAAYDVQPNSADNDPQIKANKQSADAAGRYRLVGVEKLDQHDPSLFASLIAQGDDLWVAFNVNRAAWNDPPSTNNYVIPDYNVTESSGHAVVLAGFRTVGSGKQFLIHNSWGTDWGDNGYAWIGENMVRNQLRYAYRVRVAHPNDPGGLPTPPGAGSGDCPQGQAKDVFSGQCVQACPNGAPPAMGVCAPFPGVPGSQPSPQPSPNPSPAPGSGSCPQGQAPDLLTGQCTPLCPSGHAATGGLCLPHIQ